jgi:hypothetical protein
MSERFPALPLDATGAGEGGGAGGAGGGSWIVLGSGGGTPEEPEGDGPAADTGPYLLDGFADRLVDPPVLVDGEVIVAGALGGRLSVRRGVDIDRVTPVGPLVSAGSMIPRVGSWIGRPPGSYPWTARPDWSACRFLDFTFSGWEEQEQWYRLGVPAHPTAMAGIALTVTLAAASGFAAAAGTTFDVVVAPVPPVDIRAGTVVGSVPADGGAHVVFIPGALVPAAGSDLWIGVRAGWQADLGSHACGFTLPYGSGATQTDVAGVGYMGHSGRATVNGVAAATWRVSVGGEAGIGQTADPGDAPWAARFTWRTLGSAGEPAYGIDAEGLYATSSAPAAVGFGLDGPLDEDDDEAAELDDDEDDPGDDLPTSDSQGARLDVLWWVDAVGLTEEAGARALELVVHAAGQRLAARVHLGDSERAPGISADAGAGIAYQPRDLAAGTRTWLAMDWRSGSLRAKLWEAGGPLVEPAAWDVEVPIGATADRSDRLELWLRVGNVTGSQRLTVRRILAHPAGRPGDTVVGELVGLADGASASFTAAHPYLARSLLATCWGLAVRPAAETPQEARYRLDARPPAGTFLRCRYVIAALDTEP